jgi:hypothetical protein
MIEGERDLQRPGGEGGYGKPLDRRRLDGRAGGPRILRADLTALGFHPPHSIHISSGAASASDISKDRRRRSRHPT